MTAIVFPSRYHIRGELGRGGMGTVYLAQHKWTGAERALKTVLDRDAGDHAALDRLWEEAKKGRLLKHPNIVKVYDCFVEDIALYIEMEFVEGADLRKILQQVSKVPPAVALRIAIEVCRALDYAYREAEDDERKAIALVHRDVSPANILISRKGQVKLADFGIAKGVQELHQRRSLTIAGKLPYMAPEALCEPPSHKADIYACGVVLYEMVLGLKPSDLREARGRFVPPAEIDPHLPMSLNAAICAALAEDPRSRPDAAEWRAQLETVLRELSELHGNPVRQLWDDYQKSLTASTEDMEQPVSDQRDNQRADPEKLRLIEQEAASVFRWSRRKKWLIPLGFAAVIALITLIAALAGPRVFRPSLGSAFDYHALYAANDGQQGGLWLANPDGSKRIKLADLALGERGLALSPAPRGDKAFFMFINRIGRGTLASIDRKRRLLHLMPQTLTEKRYLGGTGGSIVSPDSQWLLFGSDIRNLNGWGELFLARADWKPNLRQVEEAIIRNESPTAFDARLARLGLTRLTTAEELGLTSQFAWSPDSRQICFESADQAYQPSRIWVMNRDGSGRRMIHQCRIRCTALAWSPKGLITFTDGTTPDNSDIFVIRADGSGLDTLVATPGNDLFKEFDPQVWLFNGTGLVFQSNRDGNYDIFEVFLSDRHMGKVTAEPGDEIDGAWAPKGHMIFYRRISDESLWRIDPTPRGEKHQVNAANEKVMGYTLLRRPGN